MYRNIPKICIVIISIFSFLSIVIVKTFAIVAEPSEGDYLKGSTITIKLYAAPPEGEMNAISIYLESEGMVIENYKQPEGWLVIIGTCSDGLQFNSTEVCISMAKTELIKQGDSLGEITAKINTDGEVSLMKLEGSAYSDGQKKYDDLGTLFSSNQQVKKLENDNSLKSVITQIIIIFGYVMLIIFLIVSRKLIRRSIRFWKLQMNSVSFGK
jgi:hypothetical protein